MNDTALKNGAADFIRDKDTRDAFNTGSFSGLCFKGLYKKPSGGLIYLFLYGACVVCVCEWAGAHTQVCTCRGQNRPLSVFFHFSSPYCLKARSVTELEVPPVSALFLGARVQISVTKPSFV